MANPVHLEILKQGVETWNAWRREHAEVKPDLSGEDLDGADLEGANLCEANVEKARLYETVFAIYRHSLQGQCASVGSNLTTGVKPPWRSSIAR